MLLLNPVLVNLNYAYKGDSIELANGWYTVLGFLSGLGFKEKPDPINDAPLYANETGAAMGAFLSLWFWPLAIMWNPRTNFEDFKINKKLFWHQFAFQIAFLLHFTFTQDQTEFTVDQIIKIII
jgi:hypothetical protein